MNEHKIRIEAKEQFELLCESHHTLTNFRKRTIDRVDAILRNTKVLDLHPIVIDHLNAIITLADGQG